MPVDHDKLAKVLALAGSANDGEALAAVRRARSLLAAEGLSFTDLGERLREAAGAGNAPGSAWQKAADHLGAYLRERAERREEVDRLTAQIAELERAVRAKDRTIKQLRGELGRLAEAVERAMPAAANRSEPETSPRRAAARARPRRRGPQFELALE